MTPQQINELNNLYLQLRLSQERLLKVQELLRNVNTPSLAGRCLYIANDLNRVTDFVELLSNEILQESRRIPREKMKALLK